MGLTVQTLGVVAHRDQQRGRGVGADPVNGHQLGGGFGHQPIELLVELMDLLTEVLLATSDRRQ